jgi:hypothetical protein
VQRDGIHAVVDVLQASGRSGRTMAQWQQDLVAQAKPLASGGVSSKLLSEPAGQVVALAYDSTKIVKGHTVRAWQYAYDAGAQSYLLTFVATPASAPAYLKAIAAAAASFSLG